MKKKLSLGLDIGIGSVGWGLIDIDTGSIIDKGVRLFSAVDPANNKKRREYRGRRRLIRRKEFRIYRAKRILLEMGVIETWIFTPSLNPYLIRVKGITQKLNNEELATAILHLIKRNGFRYTLVDSEDTVTEKTKIPEEYLCIHQLKILNQEGKVRGKDNKYSYSLYEKEFLKLLDVQNIANPYRERLLDVFKTRRHFSDGPGSINSPTPYGRYLYLGAEPINLIEKMTGHCSIYPDELRAPKVCPSAEIFNLLNDLNNLSIDRQKIVGTDKKLDIINNYIFDSGKITVTKLCNELGVSKENVIGFRVDKKDNPIITESKSIKKIREAAKKANLAEWTLNPWELDKDGNLRGMEDIYFLDDVFAVLTKYKSVEERIDNLKTLQAQNKRLTDEYIAAFANITEVSGNHSLSLKALRQLTIEMINESLNSTQIIRNNHLGIQTYNGELKLPKDIVISPVAYQAINQTFKVIKAILKTYSNDNYEISRIFIEMTRSKNSQDEKDQIKNAQQRNEKERNDVIEILSEYPEEKINSKLIEKVLLYREQDSKSVYSGKTIDLNDLVTNPDNFEIDHIIPYSVSFDNSRSNKVLVYHSENQIKGQRTPHAVFHSGDKPLQWQSYSEFVKFVRNHYKDNKKKMSNLLFDADINLAKVQEEFIERNLNDTSYATSYILSALNNFLSNSDKYRHIKVHVINGKTTSMVRKLSNLKKNRDYHAHHAVDALIIASFSQSKYVMDKCLERIYDEETGEIYSPKDVKDIFNETIQTVCQQIKQLHYIDDFKFSYKIDSKPNRSISDETIYGTTLINGETYVIKNYSNIYDKQSCKKLIEILRKNDASSDNLLIKRNDPKTYDLLLKIVNQYLDSPNPFAEYKKDYGDFVRKVSGEGKRAPIITKLRYIENKLGFHIDISNKFKQNNASFSQSVMLQLSPYRMDLYYNQSKKLYKFITIRYLNVGSKHGYHVIDSKWYDNEKTKYHIDSEYVFVNSFYRNDLIEITKQGEEPVLYLFKVVTNSKENKIELSYFGMENKKEKQPGKQVKDRLIISIGKNIVNVRKKATDILGNMFDVKDEPLKLRWK